jgi:DNA-binding NarL/FixJ family response regulator
VVDGEGVVRWTNLGWRRTGTQIQVIAAARVGSDLVALGRADPSPFSAVILSGVRAVLAGSTSYVELQSEPLGGRPAMVAITPTRGGRGAVILHAESRAGQTMAAGAPLAIDATRIAEHLTPRELEVLTRMAAGLSNRVIARDLGIEYTTVRGHVQSLLAKLGAGTRVDAVARAYRSGLVRNADVEPDDRAALDVREAEVV